MSTDIASLMADVARRLLGEPNEKPKPSKGKWRYGRKGSLSIDVRKGIYIDHETNEGGGVLALIRQELPGVDPVAWLRGERIVLPEHRETRAELKKQDEEAERERRRMREYAVRLWRAAAPAAGTLVEVYLRSRGIVVPPPPTLRFCPALRHGPTGTRWPVMLAQVTREGEIIGVHRTFLARDGRGKAPVDPQKMMLGSCRFGAVRLGPAAPTIMVGEGIESTLSVMQGAGGVAWAALSAGGMRTLELPPEVREVVLCADGDEVGETAAEVAAARLVGEGRRARIARPPAGYGDFNDVLVGACHG